jgi:hypothetical protein
MEVEKYRLAYHKLFATGKIIVERINHERGFSDIAVLTIGVDKLFENERVLSFDEFMKCEGYLNYLDEYL